MVMVILECVVEVSDNLKSRYIHTRFTSEEEEWPPDQPKNFTSLSLIHHKGGRTQREAIAIAEATRSGDIDAIMSSTREQTNSLKESYMFFSQSKTSKDIKEIFAPSEDSQDPRSILIEGAPGIGKTVLSKEISIQWANGQLLINAILVFLIFLRDPLVQKIMSLKDLVKYYYQFDESSDAIASSCADYLLQSNGDGITFIFDGYDEYPESLQQTGFISDILRCKSMPKRGLVLTSRPHVSAHLHQWFERRVEILGFTKVDRQKYITSSLEEKSEDIAPLIKYLDTHVTISSLCFIPFNMTMLLWLYKQGVVLPNSSTELYNYFICHTIRHHLAKVRVVIYDNIINFDFEQPYKKIIQQLAFLSYKALNKNQLIFTLDEVKAVCPQIDKIPGAINCFGLLQVVQYPGIMKMTTMLSFVHLSLQEFLAAYHITYLPYNEELFALKEKFMSDVHANMFTMYVGITKGRRPAFRQYLKYHTVEVSLLEKCTAAFKQFFGFSEPVVETSSLCISTKILENRYMCLRLFKCFHEAGNKDMCSRLIRAGCFSDNLDKDKVDIETLTPCDVECLGLVLTSKQEWHKLSVFLSDTTVEILHRLLTTNTPTIEYINLFGHFSESSSYLIANIVLMCKSTGLTMSSITPELMSLKNQLKVLVIMAEEQNVNTLATFLHENNILLLLGLSMTKQVMCVQSLQVIADSLEHNSTLQHIKFFGSLSDEQCSAIIQHIKVVKWKVKRVHIDIDFK